MKLLKVNDLVYVLVQDDFQRGVELDLYGEPTRVFDLVTLTYCTWSGWVQLSPTQIQNVKALEVVNRGNKLKAHKAYASLQLKNEE